MGSYCNCQNEKIAFIIDREVESQLCTFFGLAINSLVAFHRVRSELDYQFNFFGD